MVSKVVPVIAIYCCAFGGTEETLFLIGTMTLILLPVTVGLTVMKVPEGRDYLPTRIPLARGLKLMWQNAPFKRLVLAFFINQLGSSISTALVVFYIRVVLQEDAMPIVFLLTYYLFNLSGIPLWVWFSGKVGKHRAWCVGLALFGTAQCDVDTLNTGEDRAAWYFAVWSFTTKVGQSIGPWLALTLLAFVGYDPASQPEPTAGGLL